MIERISPPGVAAPRGPYSPAVRAGDFIFVSGQVAVDPATQQLVSGDIAVETRQVLNNIKALLEGCGATLADVVKCGVYLGSGNDFAAKRGLCRVLRRSQACPRYRRHRLRRARHPRGNRGHRLQTCGIGGIGLLACPSERSSDYPILALHLPSVSPCFGRVYVAWASPRHLAICAP